MKELRDITISIFVFICIILLGAYAYSQVEGWRYIDSVYFTVITITTIGYGDFSPSTDAGKIFTIVFSFAGIAMAFYFLSLIGKFIFKKQLRSKLEELGRIKTFRGIRRVKVKK